MRSFEENCEVNNMTDLSEIMWLHPLIRHIELVYGILEATTQIELERDGHINVRSSDKRILRELKSALSGIDPPVCENVEYELMEGEE